MILITLKKSLVVPTERGRERDIWREGEVERGREKGRDREEIGRERERRRG